MPQFVNEPEAEVAPSSVAPQSSGELVVARNYGAAVWFLAALATVLLAAILHVGNGRAVLIPGVSTPLPESCTLRLQLGIDCPGCGLTRGFIHAAHGRIQEAFNVHSLSLPLFGVVLLQLPLALAHWIPLKHRVVRAATTWNMICILMLAALMLLRWFWILASGQIAVGW